jgi:hypothetical protein
MFKAENLPLPRRRRRFVRRCRVRYKRSKDSRPSPCLQLWPTHSQRRHAATVPANTHLLDHGRPLHHCAYISPTVAASWSKCSTPPKPAWGNTPRAAQLFLLADTHADGLDRRALVRDTRVSEFFNDSDPENCSGVVVGTMTRHKS